MLCFSRKNTLKIEMCLLTGTPEPQRKIVRGWEDGTMMADGVFTIKAHMEERSGTFLTGRLHLCLFLSLWQNPDKSNVECSHHVWGPAEGQKWADMSSILFIIPSFPHYCCQDQLTYVKMIFFSKLIIPGVSSPLSLPSLHPSLTTDTLMWPAPPQPFLPSHTDFSPW